MHLLMRYFYRGIKKATWPKQVTNDASTKPPNLY